jgi:hypothetical protein
MRSLLWKEWREQSWKLVFGSLIFAAFAFIGLHARIVADELLLQWVCFLAMALLPILASTGLVPAERDDGTLDTLFSLPIAPVRIFLIKASMGVLLTAGPILITAAVSLLIAGGREMSSAGIVGFYLRTIIAALSLFVWMFALTISLPTETRASLIAMAVLIMWILISLGLDHPVEHSVFHATAPPLESPSYVSVIDPLFFMASPQNAGRLIWLAAAAVQSIIAAFLLFAASRLFARPTSAEGL